MTLVHDPRFCKLGKGPAKPAHVMIRDYVANPSVFNEAPLEVVNSALPGQGAQTIPLAMYLNDDEGCCTCTAAGNTLRVNSKGSKQLVDGDIQVAYVAVTKKEGAAFDPATGANDNGCIPLDVLDYWVNPGIGGDKLVAHGGVNMKDPAEVRWVLWRFGSLYQGIQLATEQQNQTVWDFVKGSTPGSWGGHLFPLFDRVLVGNAYLWTGGTWAAYKQETDAFMANQADEGHAPITDAWLAANAGSTDIDVAQLQADLKAQLQSES